MKIQANGIMTNYILKKSLNIREKNMADFSMSEMQEMQKNSAR